jgi:hypothetical protein
MQRCLSVFDFFRYSFSSSVAFALCCRGMFPRCQGYLLIGIGGGLMLFDRLFGISASWMRFISASLEIEALLDEFRMRWLRAQLEAEEPQSPDTFQALIAAAADAIEGIHALALLETRAWRAEFQSGIAAQVGLGKSHTDPQASTVHSGRDRLHAMSRRS